MDELMHQVMTALRGMWRRRWIGLAVAWAVAVIGAIVLLRIPDRYEATARVYVDTQTVLKPLMAGLAVQPNVERADRDAGANVDRAPERRKDHTKRRSRRGGDDADRKGQAGRLGDASGSSSKAVGRENIYSISYQDVNPDRAKRVVQDLLSLFVESGVGNKRRDTERPGASSTSRSRSTKRSSRKPRAGSRSSRSRTWASPAARGRTTSRG